MFRAAAAAHAGNHAVFTHMKRIFVTDFLTQPLINMGAWIMAAGLQSEIREHAGIPNAAARALAK